MFAVVQTPVKLSLLSLKPEAHATELSLGKRKEQEHATHFGKGEGGKNMQLILGRVGSHPFSLLVFIAPKVCWGV